jgi:hypothetical protein
MTKLLGQLVAGTALFVPSVSLAADRALCVCTNDDREVVVWFDHEPEGYGQLSNPVSIRVSGCVERIQYNLKCGGSYVVDRYAGPLHPLLWWRSHDASLGDIWLLRANFER